MLINLPLSKLIMATPLKPIECSAQPLCISFHPVKDIVAAGLADGTVEIHDLVAKGSDGAAASSAKAKSSTNKEDDDMESDGDEDDEADTILSSIHVAKEVASSKNNTQMLAKSDSTSNSNRIAGKAAQGPSCRSVLFSRFPDSNLDGEHIYTACNGGSIRCLDSELACSLDHFQNPNAASPILWSIENAHNVGISKLYQLPHSSPCGPALVSGDDTGVVRIWDMRICGGNTQNDTTTKSGPFDNLMKPPTGCVQHWKVNHDYISDFETNNDGSTLFASSADGTLSVFDIRFVNRKGTPRSVILPNVDPAQQQKPQSNSKKSTWDTSGYTQSDNQEDELLSLALIKKSQKLLCGTQQGILSLFSYNYWGDISDRFPGHPQSIDAILKIDEDTVLTGSSDGLVRAVQLLPNALLGVLGGHDGFPVEGLGWSAGRKMVGSVSHDEYIRLWDASFLNEDGGSDEEEEEGEECREKQQPQGLKGVVSTKNDDDSEGWEDMDEDEDVDSDDESDEGGSGKPKKLFKTENEEFFSDL